MALARAMDGATLAVLFGGGEGVREVGRGVCSPVVEARVLEGVGVVLRGDDGSVLRRGCMSSGRRFRRDLGGENMSIRCASAITKIEKKTK